MRPWLLGNTTVRSPFRLREGLIALSSSSLEGNLRGGAQSDRAFRDLLGKAGIVTLGNDQTNSIGRKWRSALGKLGLLIPELRGKASSLQLNLGQPDYITENGRRLVSTENVSGMQECFLRALAAYFIPSLTEDDYNFQPFSPLRYTLELMFELERRGESPFVGFDEMALIVQLSAPEHGLNSVIDRILRFREEKRAALAKRRWVAAKYEVAAKEYRYESGTFKDYADTNFRYLKVTGLVQNKGRGITLVPEKKLLSAHLLNDRMTPGAPFEYYKRLCSGAPLPTDDRDQGLLVLRDLAKQLQDRQVAFSFGTRPITSASDIAVLRHEAEELLFRNNEERFADRQAAEWEEIAAYMKILSGGIQKKRLATGDDISIPQSEKPAYFEWVLWRAFLAIDGLTVPPYLARRFKVDQDFLPISTAPGNGPDLVLEFADYVLAVEVTLTESSRQEAAEGEPVRRHVADLLIKHQDTSKHVYGLFLANKVDSNTAETFRRGSWYDNLDNELQLNIVPIPLSKFLQFFRSLFSKQDTRSARVRHLLQECSSVREALKAPEWKAAIQEIISRFSELS